MLCHFRFLKDNLSFEPLTTHLLYSKLIESPQPFIFSLSLNLTCVSLSFPSPFSIKQTLLTIVFKTQFSLSKLFYRNPSNITYGTNLIKKDEVHSFCSTKKATSRPFSHALAAGFATTITTCLTAS